MKFLEDSYHYIEDSWYDEIGGYHSDGCGWNPYKVFCGECSHASCVGCKNATKTEDDYK